MIDCPHGWSICHICNPEKEIMSDSTHAKLAPSAASRWMNCPGSVKLCANLADVESPYAAEGTFAHKIAAYCLQNSCSAFARLGYTDDIFTCDAQMAGYIQEYVDVVRKIHDPDRLSGVGLPLSTLLVEQKVSLVGVRDDIHGTADAVIVSHSGMDLDVFDFKYGAGVLVDVDDNPQLKLYALGALLSLPECINVKEVRLHIVQPRHHAGGHRCFALHVNDLMGPILAGSETFAATIVRAAAATDAVEAKVDAGEHCRWCLAKPHCPTLRAAALERTKHLFEEVDETTILQPLSLVPAKAVDRTPAGTLTTEELGSALAAFPLIEEWMRSIREHAYDRAAKGDIVPGFKLVEKTGNRTWIDDGSMALVMEAYDAPLHAKPKLLTPAQAEKGLPKEHRAKLMNQLARKPKTGTVLVPESDKKPAVIAGDVFDDESPV